MKERKGAREPFYFLSSSRTPFKKDIKNSISCAGVKNTNFIGLRIIVKTIRLHSERTISLIEWHTAFIPFTDVPSLNFKGYINLAGQIRRRGERDEFSKDVHCSGRTHPS